MKLSLTKERKYILVGGAMLLLLALVYRFYPDLEALFSVTDQIQQKEHRLAKYQRAVQEGKVLESRIKNLEALLTRDERRLLTGKTPALAAADVQNTINAISARALAEIKTMRVLPAEESETGSYLVIPVQVTLNSSVRQLTDILYGIETAKTYLRVSKMKIRAIKRRRQPDRIQTTLTVAGMLKRGSE